jgi:hypothetical protein
MKHEQALVLCAVTPAAIPFAAFNNLSTHAAIDPARKYVEPAPLTPALFRR